MAEKAKPRGAGAAKTRRDKSRTPSARHSKHPSPKAPTQRHPKPHPTRTPPAEDGGPPGDIADTLDVEDILADLLDRVMSECVRAAVARQRVPYTVSRARDAILHIAEWRFLVRDEGDPDPRKDPDPGGELDPERDGVWSEDEEPQTCPWDSWTQGAVTVLNVPLSSGQVLSQDLSVTAEAGGPSTCPSQVPGAVPVLDVPLSSGQVPGAKPPCQDPSAAARAPPTQVPGAVTVLPVPGPPLPEPPIAPRPSGRGPRLARPPRPRPAPLCTPRPTAPRPAKPPEPPAQGPRGARGATAGVGGQVQPLPPSSCTSPGPVQPRRPSRGTGAARDPVSGVPRLGARRGDMRWILPEVKVLDVATEPDLSRPHRRGRESQLRSSRGRPPPPGTLQVLSGALRPPKPEPQLCDPWLASARLAPGVTVRWGSSERRGPGTAGHGGQDEKEEGMRKAERELRPIHPFPVCRLEGDGEL